MAQWLSCKPMGNSYWIHILVLALTQSGGFKGPMGACKATTPFSLSLTDNKTTDSLLERQTK